MHITIRVSVTYRTAWNSSQYKERYHYENVTAEIIAANEASGERVVYIVDSGQRELFDPEKYEITSIYDRFYVVKDRSKS